MFVGKDGGASAGELLESVFADASQANMPEEHLSLVGGEGVGGSLCGDVGGRGEGNGGEDGGRGGEGNGGEDGVKGGGGCDINRGNCAR